MFLFIYKKSKNKLLRKINLRKDKTCWYLEIPHRYAKLYDLKEGQVFDSNVLEYRKNYLMINFITKLDS
jgi:hypothetical protein